MALSHAQEIAVPVNLQYSLFSKVLPFDRNFRQRVDSVVTIGIIYQSKFRLSLDVKNEFVFAVNEASGVPIANLPVRLVPMDIDNADHVKIIDRAKVSFLYVAPIRAVDLSMITDISRARGILTLTGVEEYVKSGISVGIGTKGGRPQILINLAASKDEQADFSSQLLKLSKIF